MPSCSHQAERAGTAKPLSARSSTARPASGSVGAHDPLEDGDYPPAGVHRPRAQDGGNELVGVPVEDEQGMIHMLAVVAMVGRAFLLPVGGVGGAVQIEQNVGRRSAGLLPTELLALLPIDVAERDGKLVAGAAVTAFSSRDRVGWLARSNPLSGRRPQTHLSSGSWRSVSASFWSS